MKQEFDVIVIGAGVVGMATALTLIEQGHRVTVVDASAKPGMGTSHANGAQLCYAYTDALASPSTLRQLPGLMFASDSAFRLHPSLDPDFLRWGIAFLRECRASRFLSNTLEGLELAVESRKALDRLSAHFKLAFDQGMPGKLHIYRSAEGFVAASKIAAVKRDFGIEQHAVDSTGAVAIEPMLAPVGNDIAGALYTPREEVGDPHLFCTSAGQALLASGRGRAMFSTEVIAISAGQQPAIETLCGKQLSADRLVLCAGTGSPRLARLLGVRIPIQPMKGYSITAQPGAAAPSVCVTDVANRIVFARLGDRMRIAGLAELGNRDRAVDPARIDLLIATARAALPEAADYNAIDLRWAGLRPMSPNSLPVIRSIAQGVIANTAHGSLGWTYAAGSAERAARLLAETFPASRKTRSATELATQSA
ncbi:FAD-dependent oxidoreductase [Qipengyuania sp. ASV99]|uniref:FAD-dependent oxidoreductase n=1 Tax=Qipengyuania sp. ASV99 TaxID=3399681 RepID=UPI003A4C63D2